MGRQEIKMMIGGLRGVGGCQGAGKQGSAQGVFGLTSWQDQQSPPVPTKEVKSPNRQTQWHLHRQCKTITSNPRGERRP